MNPVQTWTGELACTLQAALRMTNDAFAERLGVAVRTVATWHQRPDVIPRPEMQQMLDTVLEQSPETIRARFAAAVSQAGAVPRPTAPQATPAHHLRVAIATVTRERDVLLVQPRGEDGQGHGWRFPAGMVKPGLVPQTVAIHETYAETGIHCRIVRNLGSRLHPITHVYCDYFLCAYLTGEVGNRDVAENVAVTWAPIAGLTSFIPTDIIFPPILEALEIAT
jgi:8-oxo-dGTP diphosphatase